MDPDAIQHSSSHSLSDSYARITRYFTIITFITAIAGATADTVSYFLHQFHFLFTINVVLTCILLLDLILLLSRKLKLRPAFIILLYITLLNITLTHIHVIRYENFLAKSILIGFFGILFVVLSGMVLDRKHSFLVMLWAILLLLSDIVRTQSPFLKETIPIIIITIIGLSYGVSMYMKLMWESYQKNQDALAEISRQKIRIEQQSSELRQTNTNLLDLQKHQKNLIEMIVHDMKNPLNNILNNSTGRPSRSANKSTHDAGRQMLLLAENMLDVHRMENTETILEPIALNFWASLRTAIGQVDYLLHQHDIHLETDVNKELWVSADKEILIRVFVNLFTNAIKHSPQSSRIRVSTARESRQEIIVNMEDQGEGIPEDQQEKVFERFVQLAARKSGSSRSTGLGLTFCKMSIELMQGNIWVASSSPEGTKISFTLPAAENQGTETILEAETSQEISLSGISREILIPVWKKLEKMDMYQAGKIMQEIYKVPQENPDMEQWVASVKDAVYSVNQKKYKELLNMIKTPNDAS